MFPYTNNLSPTSTAPLASSTAPSYMTGLLIEYPVKCFERLVCQGFMVRDRFLALRNESFLVYIGNV